MRPLRKRLFFRLRKSEVHFGAEHLVHTHIPVCGQQLLRAHQPQRVVEVPRHQVLATFAPIQRQHRHVGAHSARFIRQHAAVFIIGMRHDHQKAGARPQLDQALLERKRPLIRRDRVFRH
jgi:hypothetical protein